MLDDPRRPLGADIGKILPAGLPAGENDLFRRCRQSFDIQAEAAERSLGGLTPSQAAGFYNAGITASMNQWGVTDAAAITAYLAQPAVAYKGGTAGLKQIALQKWIALYSDGGQAWFEWRRTCTPDASAG